MKRNITKVITIGGGNPVVVQSMTNTRTADIKATIRHVNQLADAGAKIVRCAVPDQASALALKAIRQAIHVPLICRHPF